MAIFHSYLKLPDGKYVGAWYFSMNPMISVLKNTTDHGHS